MRSQTHGHTHNPIQDKTTQLRRAPSVPHVSLRGASAGGTRVRTPPGQTKALVRIDAAHRAQIMGSQSGEFHGRAVGARFTEVRGFWYTCNLYDIMVTVAAVIWCGEVYRG